MNIINKCMNIINKCISIINKCMNIINKCINIINKCITIILNHYNTNLQIIHTPHKEREKHIPSSWER